MNAVWEHTCSLLSSRVHLGDRCYSIPRVEFMDLIQPRGGQRQATAQHAEEYRSVAMVTLPAGV